MVENRNFNDPITCPLNQGGKEAVHPVKHRDLFNAFFLECPEGAGAALDVLALTQFRTALPILEEILFSHVSSLFCRHPVAIS
ncbi:MAG: hypothetical protein H6Q41_5586, partial [Deltaproteobacteria bacterium]|nr:hypothetical protein [Deltaproteobacteria bacterium]